MGPKKGKAKQEIIVGQYPVEEMEKQELIDYILKMKEEYVRTCEKIEHVQEEKQRIQNFWQVTEKQKEKKIAEILLLEAENEEMKTNYTHRLEEENEKLHHFEQENLQKLVDQLVENCLDRLQYEGEHQKEENVISDRVTKKLLEQQEVTITWENMLQELMRIRRDEVAELIQHHERKLSQATMKYESLYWLLWDHINVERIDEMHDAENLRNTRIQEMVEAASEQCQVLRDYFNRIASDCLALIGDLKKELETLKKEEKEQKTLLTDALNENKMLRQLQKDVEDSKGNLEDYARSKKTFVKSRKTMRDCMIKVKDLEFENHMLTEKVEAVQQQLRNLKGQFSDAVRKLQKSTSLKSVFLEKQIRVMRAMLEEKETDTDDGRDTVTTIESDRGSEQLESDQEPPKTFQYPINVVNLRYQDTTVRFVPPKLRD